MQPLFLKGKRGCRRRIYPKNIGAMAKAAMAPAKSASKQQATACRVSLMFTLPK